MKQTTISAVNHIIKIGIPFLVGNATGFMIGFTSTVLMLNACGLIKL